MILQTVATAAAIEPDAATTGYSWSATTPFYRDPLFDGVHDAEPQSWYGTRQSRAGGSRTSRTGTTAAHLLDSFKPRPSGRPQAPILVSLAARTEARPGSTAV